MTVVSVTQQTGYLVSNVTLREISIILFRALVEAARCRIPDGTACREADNGSCRSDEVAEDAGGRVDRVDHRHRPNELLRATATGLRSAVLVAAETLVGHGGRVAVNADQREHRHERRHGDEHHTQADDPTDHRKREPLLRTSDDVADGAEAEQPDRAGGEDALTQGQEGVAAALGSDQTEERARLAYRPASVDRLECAGKGEEGDDEHGVGDLVVNHGMLLGDVRVARQLMGMSLSSTLVKTMFTIIYYISKVKCLCLSTFNSIGVGQRLSVFKDLYSKSIKTVGFENKTNASNFEAFSYLLLSLAGVIGLEPTTNGFGDRYSTN